MICSQNSLSPEVVLYSCESFIRSCLEYFSVWFFGPISYLNTFDKLQKMILKVFGVTLLLLINTWALVKI